MHARTPSQKAESMSPTQVPSPLHQAVLPPANYFHPQGTSSSSSDMPRRPSSSSTLPPQSAADLQRNRLYNQNTPQSSGVPGSRGSIDSTITAAGSPSALFGGVDQLLRDSQDWWLRDQSQLAMGFEQWPMPEADWLAAASTSAGTLTNGGADGVVYAAANGGVNGGFVGVNGSGTNGVHGVNANDFGGVLNHYPNETEWYL